MRRNILLLACLIALFGCAKQEAQCPSKEGVKEAIQKIMPGNFNVVSVANLKEVPGICEAIITTNSQPVVFYVDKKGEYVISGSILEIKTKRNITAERQQTYKK